MTFPDTSFIYALADTANPNHNRARELFTGALQPQVVSLYHRARFVCVGGTGAIRIQR